MSTSPFVLLPSSHARADDTFPEAEQLEQQLRAKIRGEVRFDAASRALYATDGSNYRQVPIGVVIPLDEADVIATVAVCRDVRRRRPLPRSRHQPRRTVLQRRRHPRLLQVHERHRRPRSRRRRPPASSPASSSIASATPPRSINLTFAPDPATHSRCTLGGMIGNNSCGVHALMGGKTVDNIDSLDILLYDGTRMTVGPTTEAELAAHHRSRRPPRRDLRRPQAHPRHLRRPGPRTLPRHPPPRLRLQPRRAPPRKRLQRRPRAGRQRRHLRHHPRRHARPRCTARSLPHPRRRSASPTSSSPPTTSRNPRTQPIGLEGFDGLLLDVHAAQETCRRRPQAPSARRRLPARRVRRRHARPKPTPRRTRFVAALEALPTPPTARIYTPDEAERVWHVRESGLGATAFVPGEPTRLGRLGRRRRRRPNNSAPTSAPSTRAHRRVRLPQRPCTATSARAASTAHQLRPRDRRRHPQVPRVHRPRRRHRPRATAARSPANTATARPAARSCPRCSARS